MGKLFKCGSLMIKDHMLHNQRTLMNKQNNTRFRILVVDDESVTAIGRVLCHYLNPFPYSSTAGWNIKDFNKDANHNWTAEVHLCSTTASFKKKGKNNFFIGSLEEIKKPSKWDIIITDFHFKNSSIDGPWNLLYTYKYSHETIVNIYATSPELELRSSKFYHSKKIDIIPDILYDLSEDKIRPFGKDIIHQRVFEMIDDGLKIKRSKIYPHLGNTIIAFRNCCAQIIREFDKKQKCIEFKRSIEAIMCRVENIDLTESDKISDREIDHLVQTILESRLFNLFKTLIDFSFEFENKRWCFQSFFPIEFVKLMQQSFFQSLFWLREYSQKKSSQHLMNIYCLRSIHKGTCTLPDHHTTIPCIKILQSILIFSNKSRSFEIANFFYRSGFYPLGHNLNKEAFMKQFIPDDMYNIYDHYQIARECFKNIHNQLNQWSKDDRFVREVKTIMAHHEKPVLEEIKSGILPKNSKDKYQAFQGDCIQFRNNFLPSKTFKDYITRECDINKNQIAAYNSCIIDLEFNEEPVIFPHVDELIKIWEIFISNLRHVKNKDITNIRITSLHKKNIMQLIFANSGSVMNDSVKMSLKKPYDSDSSKLSRIAGIYEPYGRFILQSVQKDGNLWAYDVYAQKRLYINEIPEFLIWNDNNETYDNDARKPNGTAYIFEIDCSSHFLLLKK